MMRVKYNLTIHQQIAKVNIMHIRRKDKTKGWNQIKATNYRLLNFDIIQMVIILILQQNM